MAGARNELAAASTAAKSAPSARWQLARLTAWTVALVAGAYLRWSYLELTEFGIDAQTAVQMGRAIRLGWEYPLAGPRLGVSSQAGPVEYYLMAIPQLLSDSPEVSAAFVGLLGLLAGLVVAAVAKRFLGTAVALAAFVLFVTGPWAVYFARKVWTPDAFPFFTALVFALLALAFVERRRFALPLALLVLGLEVQLHLAAVVLLPAVALLIVVFIRRLRLWELMLGAGAFLIALAPFLYYNNRTNFEDLRFLLQAGGQSPDVDLRSLDILQTLVSGSEFPATLGLVLPNTAAVLTLPVISYGIVVAFWAGVVLGVSRVARAWRRGALSQGEVIILVALIWTLVPPLINLRHSVPIYLRYELYLLPVAFLFPALAVEALARWLQRALGSRPGQEPEAFWHVGAAFFAALLLVIGGWGAVTVESVNRAILDYGYSLQPGAKDVYSGPPIRDTRLALSRLETFVRPDRESIIVGNVERGPLEYLANSRYRLRFSDESRVLILPPHEATLAILPESAGVAEVARAFGAVERTDLDLRWPPDDRKARVFDVASAGTALPPDYVAVEGSQVLANGLELVAYAATDSADTEFGLTVVWRVANAAWAHKFWLYNSFVNLYTLDGRQVPASGEVELSTSSNWRQGDLLVVPTKVQVAEPLARALYKIDAGVYVRFPPRVEIPKEPGSLEVASLGSVALGPVKMAKTRAKPRARFGDTIRLLSATASLSSDKTRVEVVTEWEALSTPERDYTLFTHLYDGNGQLVAQADGPPVAGNYPTSAWLANEVVADQRAIVLAPGLPQGRYTVKLGLYDATTLERLTPDPDHGDRAFAVGHLGLGRVFKGYDLV